MADFYVSLSNNEIASQIAALLNTHNQLLVSHNAVSIGSGASNYFVEISRTAQGISQVVGCAGLLKEFPTLSKIYHVSVRPDYRNMGIAKKLIGLAIQNCETERVYMTVREGNVPSLKMASSLNFKFVDKMWSRSHDHMVILVGRRTRL